MTRSIWIVWMVIAAAGCGQQREGAAGPAAATSTVADSAATPDVATVGKPMPAYSAKLLDGSDFDVASERGNVVFLNVWATWCGPCRYEIPELEKLHNEHASRRFKVVGVSVDEGGDQVVRDFVDEQKMTYPVALDPEGRLASLLDTTILPTSVILDRQGNVVWKKFGMVTLSDAGMLSALEQALKS